MAIRHIRSEQVANPQEVREVPLGRFGYDPSIQTEEAAVVQTKRATRVEAVVEDAYDGVIRLLNDAQRFGYGLLEMAVTEVEGLKRVSLTLASPPQADARLLAARLGRHLTVVQVEARDVFVPETVHAFLEAQAA